MKQNNPTSPLSKNQTITLDITALGSEGQGLGRYEGLVVFVPQTLPGECVQTLIIKVTAKYAVGKLLRILTPSDERCAPPCPVFGRCGGCQLQHMSYPAQLAFKRMLMSDALKTIGGIAEPDVLDTVGMDIPWRYRNKGIFPVSVYNSRPQMGMYAQRSHTVVPIEDCPIQPTVILDAVSAVRRWADGTGISIYDETTGRGLLRHVLVRSFEETGATIVAVVTNGTELKNTAELIEQLRAAVPGLQGIVQNINTENTNVVLGRNDRVLWGNGHIPTTLHGNAYEIGIHSFFQVNTAGMEKLYALAAKAAELTGSELVIDAYCGVGTIGQYMAPMAGKVIGIESVQQSIDEAKRSAARNGITNVEYLCGRAETVFEEMAANGIKPDVIVMDPPRKGCDERFLQAVIKTGAQRLVYVSCNPATLARDAKFLLANGYRIGPIQPVDMFPQTSDVESVSCFNRL